MRQRNLDLGEEGYCLIVRRGLREICGYSDQEIESYFARWDEIIHSSSRVFFCEPPAVYILSEMLPSEYRKAHDFRQNEDAVDRMIRAFQNDDIYACYADSFDWEAARLRVLGELEKVLAEAKS